MPLYDSITKTKNGISEIGVFVSDRFFNVVTGTQCVDICCSNARIGSCATSGEIIPHSEWKPRVAQCTLEVIENLDFIIAELECQRARLVTEFWKLSEDMEKTAR